MTTPTPLELLAQIIGSEYADDQAHALAQLQSFLSRPEVAALSDPATCAAAASVIAERQRQIEKEGWTLEHDDEHSSGQMAEAAAVYAIAAADPEGLTPFDNIPTYWPWGREWYKPGPTPRRALEKAGALILAEIERLDRHAASAAAKAAGEATEDGLTVTREAIADGDEHGA